MGVVEQHKWDLKSQGNVFTFKQLGIHLLVGQLQRRVVSFDVKTKQSVELLSLLRQPVCELIALEAFELNGWQVIGAAVREYAEDTERFSLKFWWAKDVHDFTSDCRCTSINDLDFVPYQLNHFEGGRCFLAGSDSKIHHFLVKPFIVEGVEDSVTSSEFPEFGCQFPNDLVPIKFKFLHLNPDTRWTGICFEDGTFQVLKIENQVMTRKLEHSFEGLCDLEFITRGDNEWDVVAASTLEPSVVFQDVETSDFSKRKELEKSFDFDVVTCCILTHQHLVLGTYGQEVLGYNSTNYELDFQHSVSSPILGMIQDSMQIYVMTTTSIEVCNILSEG